MIQKRRIDDAVSPVVGVMLMVVVTVVIAAVITAFATGIIGGDDTSVSSTVMIEVSDMTVKPGTDTMLLYSVDYLHRGGDSIPLENIEFTFRDTSAQTITNYFPGYLGTVTVSGKSANDGVIVGVGDIIRVTITGYSLDNAKYGSEHKVAWTMYDTRTDAVIAEGVLIVPYE